MEAVSRESFRTEILCSEICRATGNEGICKSRSLRASLLACLDAAARVGERGADDSLQAQRNLLS